jgi:hypothetical protein
MTVCPILSNAAAQARCMELFDAGAWMMPESVEGRMIAIIVNVP